MIADNSANKIPVDPTGIFSSPVPVPVVDYDTRTQSTVAAVAELDTEREEVLAELIGDLEARVIGLETERDLTLAELTGQLDRLIDDHENEIAKAAQKVYTSARSDIDKIYQTMNDGGMAVPVMDHEVVNDLANPEPYDWVIDRLSGNSPVYAKTEPTQTFDIPSQQKTDTDILILSPPYSPPIQTPPIDGQVEWPGKSIFDEFCRPDIVPPVGWVEITAAEWSLYQSGAIPLPQNCLGWEFLPLGDGCTKYYLVYDTPKPTIPPVSPSPPTIPPKSPGPPATTACDPLCVGASYIATISFGPACPGSSPLPTSPGGGTSPPTVPPKSPPPTPPVPPAPKGEGLADLPRSEWDDPATCQTMHDVVANPVIGQTPHSFDTSAWLDKMLPGGDTGPSFPEWILTGGPQSTINDTMATIAIELFKMGSNGVDDVLTNMEKSGWPVNHVVWSTMGILTASGFLSQWMGAPLDYVTTPIRNMMQYSFPVNIPSQADLDNLYLKNYIDTNYWECLTRAQGNLPNLHRMVRDAQQSRVDIRDLVELYYRKTITYSELVIECRKRGVTDASEITKFVQLHYSYPTLPDLMRMMVREVQVQESVEQDRLAEGFGENYTGKIREWGEIAGIPEEVAYYEWLAHWQEISPSQAYTMFQRLRPGRDPSGVVFERNRLERTLREADYPPGLIDQLIAISYNPITRTDAIKGYYSGTIDREELGERFQDVGYSPDNSNLLVQILHDDRERRTINQGGQWTPRRILKEYRDSIIDRSQAEALLTVYYKDQEQRNQQLDAAEEIQTAEIRRKCMGGVRRRFLIGEYDDTQANAKLLEFGFPADSIETLIMRWNCEKYTRRKEPTVKFLQQWYSDGLITYTELVRRLLNLGYSPDDADRIAAHTYMTEEKRKAKEAEAVREKAEREAKKNAPKPAKAPRRSKA